MTWLQSVSVTNRAATSRRTTSNGKYGDVVSFHNDGRKLVLNQTTARQIAALLGDDTDQWPNGWIALFCDETVKFGDEIRPGVRVRPTVPHAASNGPVPVKKPPEKPAFDDDIPF